METLAFIGMISSMIIIIQIIFYIDGIIDKHRKKQQEPRLEKFHREQDQMLQQPWPEQR